MIAPEPDLISTPKNHDPKLSWTHSPVLREAESGTSDH